MQRGIFNVRDKTNFLPKCLDGTNRPKSRSKGCSLRLYCDLRLFSHKYHNFYRKTLLRNMFRRWENAWRNTKLIQKRSLEAKCHYNNVLTTKAFKRWTLYIRDRREYLENVVKSSTFYERRLLASCFKKLKLRHAVFQGFKQILHLSQQIFAVLIIKQRYLLSIKCTVDGFYYLIMEEIASLLWAYVLQRNAFASWRSYFMHKVKRKKAQVMATTYYEEKLKMSILHFWKSYHHSRKVKLKVWQISKQYYSKLLVSKYLHQWTRKYRKKVIYDSMSVAAHTFCERRLLRIHFNCLKSYWGYKRNKRQKILLADNFYTYRLKKKGMESLHSYSDNKKMYKSLMNKAKKIGDKVILSSSWKAWKAMMEMGELAENISYYEQADFHYRKVLLAKYFRNMVTCHRIRKRKSYVSEIRQHFSLEIIRCFYLKKWEIKWRENHHSRILDEKGKATHDFRTKKKIIELWKKRWTENKKISDLKTDALAHWEYQIQLKYFMHWLNNVNESKRIPLLEMEAVCYWETKLKSFAMDQWKKHLAWKREKHLNNIKSRIIYHNSLKLNMLRRWIAVCASTSAQEELAERFKRNMLKKEMKNILMEWKNVIDERKHYISLIKSFHLDHERDIKLRTLSKWKKLVICKKRKRFFNLNHSAYALESRINYLKKDCIIRWRNNYIGAKQGRKMNEVAVKFHEKLALSSCFAIWDTYHSIQLQKKLLQEKTTCLLLKKIQRWLPVWRKAYHEKKTETVHMMMAINFWRNRKLEVALKTWTLFVNYKKEKKSSLMQAADKHKQIMQEAIISQFIKASIVKKMREEQAFLDIMLKMNARQFQLGIKYGERWRDKVWKAKSTRSTQWLPPGIDGIKKMSSISGDIRRSTKESQQSQTLVAVSDNRTRTKPRIPHFLLDLYEPSTKRAYAL